MENINRRSFLKKSGMVTTGAVVTAPFVKLSARNFSPSDTVNVAVIGIRSRGKNHYNALAKIPNVNVTTICDIDERLLPEAADEVEKLFGKRPAMVCEYRKVLEDQDIDAVSIATPNHWHALQTIWACQAGKDVYVEKPVSHTVLEGRKMVEAARKYKRVVQTGTQARSSKSVLEALDFVQNGGLGDIYMTKGLCLKPRGSLGHTKNSPVPDGVNWDAFLGPAPYRPFNKNRFHYKWHWFWDTGNGDLGNQGPHQADIGRWAMNKRTHPVKIQGTGGFYVWDSDQETFNTQHLEFEYDDGRVLQFEVRGLGTNPEGGIRIGNLLYGSKGWMSMTSEDVGINKSYFTDIQVGETGFSSYKEEEGPSFINENPHSEDAVVAHFSNFIDCVRSGRWQDLNADIMEGHLSSSVSHLGNIACKLGRTLHFNPHAETFVNDPEADSYLTKAYRSPYDLPDKV
ncbi:MAG: Gfo/Idh/MocA family oxidoreductase [Bacteroidota bacterium]